MNLNINKNLDKISPPVNGYDSFIRLIRDVGNKAQLAIDTLWTVCFFKIVNFLKYNFINTSENVLERIPDIVINAFLDFINIIEKKKILGQELPHVGMLWTMAENRVNSLSGKKSIETTTLDENVTKSKTTVEADFEFFDEKDDFEELMDNNPKELIESFKNSLVTDTPNLTDNEQFFFESYYQKEIRGEKLLELFEITNKKNVVLYKKTKAKIDKKAKEFANAIRTGKIIILNKK